MCKSQDGAANEQGQLGLGILDDWTPTR